ncbi:MAG: OmpA family protein [Rhodobacteraceae bacterium]|nr:OmpA family protein [Paracoccaceae bacterium]
MMGGVGVAFRNASGLCGPKDAGPDDAHANLDQSGGHGFRISLDEASTNRRPLPCGDCPVGKRRSIAPLPSGGAGVALVQSRIGKGEDMTAVSLRSSTAVIIAVSLMQPLPALAQLASPPERAGGASSENRNGRADRRTPEETCAEAMVFDALACELHLLSSESASAVGARARPDAAGRRDGSAQPVNGADVAEGADPEGKAEADAADSRGEADARAQEARETEASAKTVIRAEAEAEAELEARAEAEKERAEDESTDTAQGSEPVAIVEDCLAEVIASDGTIVCADTLIGATVAAIGAGADDGYDATADVVTEIVTESDTRSSDEEFRDVVREDDDVERENGQTEADSTSVAAPAAARGLSDLEKAGLFVLGAAVVGAVLTAGQRVESNTGDRVIVIDDDGQYRVLKDDDALLRQPGSEMRTERFADGSTRTTVTREDGARIITVRDSAGRALRRVRIEPDGREYLLIDDTRPFEPVVLRDLPRPSFEDISFQDASDRESLRAALLAAEQRDIGRSFSLRQVRDNAGVRALAPVINLEAVTFATNSAAVQPSQAERLRQVGLLMRDLVIENPTELFLIEGHTDAVGNAGYNLLLSDRRAESVALALSEYFGVPAENMVIQGYGEGFLRVATEDAERLNRRVAVRRITTLVRPR